MKTWQREQAEERKSSTMSAKNARRDRARILAAEGVEVQAIADRLCVTRETVYRWLAEAGV